MFDCQKVKFLPRKIIVNSAGWEHAPEAGADVLHLRELVVDDEE